MTKVNSTITKWSFVWLIAALAFAVLVFRVVLFNLVDADTIKDDLLLLPLSIWFILFAVQFKAIRKTYVFICWFVLACLLLAMKIWITKYSNLAIVLADSKNTNYIQGLVIPFLLLIFYQTCRQISLKYYNNELSMPSRIRNYVYDENRKANWLERFTAIGFFVIPLIVLYA